MLQDATVNGIRNALEDQRKAAYRKYPVFTMPRHRIERPWESRRFPGGSPGGHRRDPRELKGTRRAQEGTARRRSTPEEGTARPNGYITHVRSNSISGDTKG